MSTTQATIEAKSPSAGKVPARSGSSKPSSAARHEMDMDGRTGLKSWASSFGVLLCLGGVGYWGHHTHWNFQNFAPETTSVAAAELVSGNSGPSPDAPRLITGELPPVQFDSAAGAANCGIIIEPAALRTMDESVSANAVVNYDQTHLAQLAMRVSGTVAEVVRHQGEQVRAGDVLMVVDSAEVGQAKASLLEACVTYHLKFQRAQRLSKIGNAIPGRERVEAEGALELSRAQRFLALQKLINLGFTISLDEIESKSADEVAEFLHRLGLADSMSAQSPSDNLIPLLAPFDGVVTRCDVVQGEAVTPQQPFYTIADIDRMWIELSVRQDDADRLKLQAPVTFVGELKSRTVTGRLTWIGTEVDRKTRTVQARAVVENPPLDGQGSQAGAARLLHAGAYGDARILIQSHPQAVAVPNDAMHWVWEIGSEVLFIASEDGRTFTPRRVTKGLTRDGRVQVLEGIQPGERIATQGSRVLAAELSEHLQNHLGDNAEATRLFHHAEQAH